MEGALFGISLKEKLIINQRRATISNPPSFGPAAAGIEIACAGFGIVGIETNGVGRPRFGNFLRLVQASSSNALTLPGGGNGHGQKIDWLVRSREVALVYRPGLFGG